MKDCLKVMEQAQSSDLEKRELDVVEFAVRGNKFEDISLVRSFITKVLKKAHKLRVFKCSIDIPLFHNGSLTPERFLIEEVAHLYESLEKFEYTLINWNDTGFTKYDLRVMKPFKNLKEVRLDGDRILYENIEEIVDLLQGNNHSVLEIEMESLRSTTEGLREMLKTAKIKRVDRNLKVRISLKFKIDNFVGLLDELCAKIESVKTIKGLEIRLSLVALESHAQIPTESLRGALGKYLKIRNWVVEARNRVQLAGCERIAGEKEQFLL